jgi:integrase
LEQALPPIRAPHTAIGHYLSPSQLRDFLRAFDDHQPAGVRDYAMALLAAKLGLRAKEIAQLSLEDVNWKAGTLRLDQTKGRRSRLLPLSAPVGQAMAKSASSYSAPTGLSMPVSAKTVNRRCGL